MTQDQTARALWIVGKEQVALRDVALMPTPDAVEVRTLFTGISRGTERLVFRGEVPLEEHDTMRAPFQEGTFAFPVKYGYSAVGEVQSGDGAGSLVFALFPHQTRFIVPETDTTSIPANVPPARAVLAANMETALNVTWDARVSLGDRVMVIGCGVVGALVAYLIARMPGTEVTVVDIDPTKQILATALGCDFALPEKVETGCADLVVHASASSAGLKTAIAAAGRGAKIIEASWYGTQNVDAPLGGRFHQGRLQLISSQVGQIPAHQAPRWTYGRRMAKALSLLADPTLDVLISAETPFEALAEEYRDILMNPSTLCHRVSYTDG